jgi:alkylation response protein AidB-like acyl-CoA dehydrogenase
LADDEQARGELLPPLAAGRTRGVVAFSEGADPDWRLTDLATAAARTPTGWRINGRKVFAIDAGGSDWAVVSARRDDDGSTGLFVVQLADAGVTPTCLGGADLTRSCWSLEFVDAPGRLLECGDTGAAVAAVRDRAMLGLAAEMLGGIRHCVTATVEYGKVRYQFGRPIGSFQAVKHRCADMYAKLELTTAAVRRAEEVADTGGADLTEAVLVAHSLAARYFLDVAEDMVHLHGGIGFTWEHEAHWYLRRAIVSALILGTPESSLDLLADRLGL